VLRVHFDPGTQHVHGDLDDPSYAPLKHRYQGIKGSGEEEKRRGEETEEEKLGQRGYLIAMMVCIPA